jgi:hypothetical protein
VKPLSEVGKTVMELELLLNLACGYFWSLAFISSIAVIFYVAFNMIVRLLTKGLDEGSYF